jgi:hypothetical protein
MKTTTVLSRENAPSHVMMRRGIPAADVNKEHNKDVDAKYGNPTRLGLPVIVILDAGGTVLTTKNTAELEEGSIYDSARVLAFLNEWSTR